jgi:hypothetical protein
MKSQRKAQTEIIGLVIVIILVILGISFATRFISGPTDYKKRFTQTEIASNTLNALLKTTSNCNELSMTELLQTCVENPGIICGNSQNSCEHFILVTQQIFSKTLEKWGVDYEFKVFQEKENPLFALGTTCIGDKKSEIFPIPADSGVLFVKLDICG